MSYGSTDIFSFFQKVTLYHVIIVIIYIFFNIRGPNQKEKLLSKQAVCMCMEKEGPRDTEQILLRRRRCNEPITEPHTEAPQSVSDTN